MIIINGLLFALTCFFGGSVILGLAFVAARFAAPHMASHRHLIWTVGFAMLLLLPLALLAVPAQLVWHLAPALPAPAEAVPMAAAPAAEEGIGLPEILLALTAIWAAGVLFHLSKAVYGAVCLCFLHRASVPHIPQGLCAAAFDGLRWQLRLRTEPGTAGPITYGLIHPVVLLPKASVLWPRDRLAAVLLHEAAHVRRHDGATRLIALLAAAFYWPNPLVWMALAAMRRDGESAADDMVLQTGLKPSHYAGHLVELAREFAGVCKGGAHGGMSLAMAEPAMLDARIEAILDSRKIRQGASKMDVFKLAMLGVAATAVLALVRPALAAAEETVPHDNSISTSTRTVVREDISDPAHPMVQVSQTSGPAAAGTQRRIVRVVDTQTRSGLVRRIEVSDGDATESPPAPPAPPAPAAPPAPPAPAVAPPPPPYNGDTVVKLSEAQKAAIRRQAAAEARRAVAEARKAIAALDIQHIVAEALKSASAAQAEAQKSVDAAAINATVDKALRQAEESMRQAEIQAAKADRAAAAAEKASADAEK